MVEGARSGALTAVGAAAPCRQGCGEQRAGRLGRRVILKAGGWTPHREELRRGGEALREEDRTTHVGGEKAGNGAGETEIRGGGGQSSTSVGGWVVAAGSGNWGDGWRNELKPYILGIGTHMSRVRWVCRFGYQFFKPISRYPLGLDPRAQT